MGNIQQHSSNDGPIGTKDLIIKQEMDQTQLIDQVQKLQAELDSHKQKFAQLQTDFNDLKTKLLPISLRYLHGSLQVSAPFLRDAW